MQFEQSLKMDLDYVRRLLGQDIEILNKSGLSHIAVAETVPICLDKGTEKVKLAFLPTLPGINISLDGIDAYHLKSDDFVFANIPKNIQNLAGLKDASGTKRLIIIQPGDDVKAKLEAAPNGSWVLIFPGEYYVSESIDLSQKTNLRITGFGFEKGTDYDPTIIYTDQNINLFDLTGGTATNIVIENMRLEQRGSRAGRGIYAGGSSSYRYYFRRLLIYNFTTGIHCWDHSHSIFESIITDHCSEGIQLSNAYQVTVRDFVSRYPYRGLYLRKTVGCIFSGIHCYSASMGVSYVATWFDVHPGSLLTGFTCRDCSVGIDFYTTESGHLRTMAISNGIISANSTSAVAVRWSGSYGYAPVSIANVRLLGQFGYGFQDTVTNSSSDFVINLLMGVDALNASFANAAFDMPHLAEIKEVGHNPGLL